MSWAALQEAVIHDNADARFVAKKCMRWNTDYKRQLVLEDMYFRKQIPESLRDLLAPHIKKDPFQDAFSQCYECSRDMLQFRRQARGA